MIDICTFRYHLSRMISRVATERDNIPSHCTVVVSCEQAVQWLEQERERLWQLYQLSLLARSSQEGVETILRTVMPKETNLNIIFVSGNEPVRVMCGTYEEIG